MAEHNITPEPELNVEAEMALHEAIFEAIYSSGTTHKVQKLAVDKAVVKMIALIQQVSDQRVRKASERFDDQTFRHWGIHSDHDEIKAAIFELPTGYLSHKSPDTKPTKENPQS